MFSRVTLCSVLLLTYTLCLGVSHSWMTYTWRRIICLVTFSVINKYDTTRYTTRQKVSTSVSCDVRGVWRCDTTRYMVYHHYTCDTTRYTTRQKVSTSVICDVRGVWWCDTTRYMVYMIYREGDETTVASHPPPQDLPYSNPQTHMHISTYGVATISRLLEIIGLFCRISTLL